jgi:hypothetical protein
VGGEKGGNLRLGHELEPVLARDDGEVHAVAAGGITLAGRGQGARREQDGRVPGHAVAEPVLKDTVHVRRARACRAVDVGDGAPGRID